MLAVMYAAGESSVDLTFDLSLRSHSNLNYLYVSCKSAHISNMDGGRIFRQIGMESNSTNSIILIISVQLNLCTPIECRFRIGTLML